jgi:hypothetical protein
VSAWLWSDQVRTEWAIAYQAQRGQGIAIGARRRTRVGVRFFYGPDAERKATRDTRRQPTSPRSSPAVPR